jgi:hypothetical protein
VRPAPFLSPPCEGGARRGGDACFGYCDWVSRSSAIGAGAPRTRIEEALLKTPELVAPKPPPLTPPSQGRERKHFPCRGGANESRGGSHSLQNLFRRAKTSFIHSNDLPIRSQSLRRPDRLSSAAHRIAYPQPERLEQTSTHRATSCKTPAKTAKFGTRIAECFLPNEHDETLRNSPWPITLTP